MHKAYSSKPQQEYVVKGAMATCMYAAVPAMVNTIMDNMFVNYNGKLTATTMSLGPVFPSFGVCTMVPTAPKPCACMIVKWDFADNSVTLNRIAHPLTKMSRGQCALGTPMCISFVTTGQFPIPGVPGFAAPILAILADLAPLALIEPVKPLTPNLLHVITLNQKGDIVYTVPEDGYVTIAADTKGHEIGDPVVFDAKKYGKFTGYVEKDNRAYARYCYFGRPDDIDDEKRTPVKTNSDKQSSKNKSEDKTSSSESQSKDENTISEDLLKEHPDALEHIDLETFQRSAWDHPDDGFDYDIENGNVDLKGMSKEEFQDEYKRPSGGVAAMTKEIKDDSGKNQYEPYTTIDGKLAVDNGAPLSPKEHKKMLEVRHGIYDANRADKNTVFQKVVCCDKSFDYWINSVNNRADEDGALQISGSTILAKDGKHLKNPKDYYDGLQLNYDSKFNSYYKPEDMKAIYVVRYTTDEPQNAKIPVHNINEVPKDINGDFVTVDDNKYPFTGNGFTPGTEKDKNGKTKRWGTPELMARPPQKIKSAIVVRIDPDGKETIVGYSKVVGLNKNKEPLLHFECVR